MFSKNYTKWIPFGNYNWANNTDYIVFVRKNLKTGMLQFRTKMVHSAWRSKSPFVPKLIDTQKAWDEITKP